MTGRMPTQEEINDFVRAAAFEVIGKVDGFLEEYPQAVDGHNAHGDTALVLAAWVGRPDVVDLLLKRGANVNIICNQGFTALISAAKMGRCDIARRLIDHGADVAHRDDQGNTARDVAIENKREEMVLFFDSYGHALKRDEKILSTLRRKKTKSPFGGRP